MKIALINGSPRAEHTSSGNLMHNLERYFPEKCEVFTYGMHTPKVSDELIDKLNEADALVFLFPLYFDSVPSHLVSCFEQLEKGLRRGIRIYGVVNCGFFEGVQTVPAFEVMENWCLKAGFSFCGGMGVGGGGVLSMVPVLEDKSFTKFGVLLDLKHFAKLIAGGKNCETKYTSVTMPRIFYKVGAEICWRWRITSNGKRISELKTRY